MNLSFDQLYGRVCVVDRIEALFFLCGIAQIVVAFHPKNIAVLRRAAESSPCPEEDTQKLDEVVVVGYGTSSKRKLTTSVGNVNSDDIQSLAISNAGEALVGRLAGVIAESSSGQPGAAPITRIRGYGSINAGSEPLYVIDGMVASASLQEFRFERVVGW